MAKKVFICHNSNDHDFVLVLAQKLRDDQIEVWIDDWDLEIGDSIIQKINEGLSSSDFLIAVISNNSIESDWVQKELNSTFMRQLGQKDIFILPVLLEFDLSNLPPLLGDLYCARFSRQSFDALEYEKLISPIKKKREAESIRKFQDSYFDNIEQLDLILGKRKPTQQQVEFTLSIIKDKAYYRYFFKKVDKIIWFDILKDNEFFVPQNNPKPKESEDRGYFSIPYWDVLTYLEKIPDFFTEDIAEKYTDALLRIIIDTSNYRDSSGNKVDNYHSWHSFTEILLKLPNNKIPLDVIELISIWLDSDFKTSLISFAIPSKLLSKFLSNTPSKNDIKKAEKIIELITAIKWVKQRQLPTELADILPERKEEPESYIETYWLRKGFKLNNNKIAANCSNKPIEIFHQRLSEIFNRKGGDYSYIWFKSLHHDPEFPSHSTEELYTLVLRDLIKETVENHIAKSKEIIEKFIIENYPLFQRLCIYAISFNWKELSNYFWELVNLYKDKNILRKYEYESEIYILLERNVNNFSESDKQKIHNLINGGGDQLKEEKYEKRKIDYFKQKWFSALVSEQLFKKEYENHKALTGVEEEIGFKSIETRVGPGPSPLSIEQILAMSNEQLGDFIDNFKSKNLWDGPTDEGLATSIKKVASENPSKFVQNLDPFSSLGYLYVSEMLRGFDEAWIKNLPIDWDRIFTFIDKYISQNKFWNDGLYIEQEERANHQWVVSSISELIQSVSKKDDHAFSDKLIPSALKITYKIIDNFACKDEQIADPLTHTLNSPIGKTINALFDLTLSIARLNKEKTEKEQINWSEEIKYKFEYTLNKKIPETYTIIGQFLPNFFFLDRMWIENKLIEFIDLESDKLWYCFMVGYLYTHRVYKDIYHLMRSHYIKAIDFPFTDRYSPEGLVHHICIGYLNNFEKYDDSLFKELIDLWNHIQILEVIRFLMHDKDSFNIREEVKDKSEEINQQNENLRKKILFLWKIIFEKFRNQENVLLEDKRIISSLCHLMYIFQEFNEEIFQWLMLTARFISTDYNTPPFIENLNNLKSAGDSKITGNYLGRVFLEMLNTVIPDYDKKYILEIVEFIYDSGSAENFELANKICDTYGKNGYDFLRELYFKYN